MGMAVAFDLRERVLVAVAQLVGQAARGNGDKVVQVVVDVLLDGVGGAEIGTDVGVDFVPGAAELFFQVAAQGLKIFVEDFAALVADVAGSHGFVARLVVGCQGAASGGGGV